MVEELILEGRLTEIIQSEKQRKRKKEFRDLRINIVCGWDSP
jgi:hypothetical protein